MTELLGKALAKERTERYQHAGDFELDLRRFKRALESNSLASSRMLAGTKTPAQSWRFRVVWAAMILTSIIAASYLAWSIGHSSAQPGRASLLENARVTPLTVDPGFEGEPTFAPDSLTIAYVSDRTGNFDIYLKQISGGPDINLTNNSADDMQPAFSPDGKQIAFVSSRQGQSDCLCFFIYGTDQPRLGWRHLG